MRFISISLFGLLGVFSRYFVDLAINKIWMPRLPLATFSINLLGAFLIGIIYVLGVERAAISTDLRLGLMVGFLGGFTTFSSYALEAARLVDETEYLYAGAYLLGSPLLGLVAAWGGMMMTRKLYQVPISEILSRVFGSG